MGMFDFFKKKDQPLAAKPAYTDAVAQYRQFYDANQSQPLSFYGLIPYEQANSTPFHNSPYEQTLLVNFAFDAACVWEDIEDEAVADEKINAVKYGNIPIAREGCGMYWILITTGKHQGEVWLLTESGITPVAENLRLDTWKEYQLKSGNTFWYPAVKHWGPIENAFFLSHAPKKMAAMGNDVFGTSSSMCRSCLDYLSRCAVKHQKEFFVTDPEGTRIFGTDGHIELIKN
ncbi:hypothetical protein HF324_11320 [Chitinophaga oryzae]|uniref:Uncharacterized protein n=1 Tax=Chitinophaga oryzae TaxID=2725414 RepID=A0ABX6LHT8_9BACT|nr:hypothetical protein [Chitinophaga oryzae]QJB38423.1 hypothetical protein HF324_11320 [Chitinophaga oryzae]